MNYRQKARRDIEHKMMMMMTVESFHTADRQTDRQPMRTADYWLKVVDKQGGANKVMVQTRQDKIVTIVFYISSYLVKLHTLPYHTIPYHIVSYHGTQ